MSGRRPPGRVREVAGVFARLGLVAFGGPAAHVAMMREELVRRRGWVDDARFVDLMGATNLVPGPNSTELAMHLGWDRARWRGLLAAGACFILPAALLVTVLAWGYVAYGSTPAVEGLLYGVVPVVLGIVLWALVPLLRTVLTSREGRRSSEGEGPRVRPVPVVLAAAALAAYLLGVHELVVLGAGALAGALVHLLRQAGGGQHALVLPLLGLAHHDDRLLTLWWTMLKIGAVLYGSGYVLLAFLEGDFVERLGWVTQQQLLDAVSVGQVTPGPVFTTATFLGYLVAGLPGAFVATVAIFTPSFVFVGLLTRITDLLRATPWTAAVLDAVNAVALALMAGVTWVLAREALVDPLTVGLTVAAVLALWRTSLNSAWLVGGGAVVGLLVTLAA